MARKWQQGASGGPGARVRGDAQHAMARALGGELETLPLDHVRPDEGQPRKHFDAGELRELGESLRRDGQRQPIEVMPADTDGMHTIITGERRWRAAHEAGLEAIQAIIRPADVNPGLLQLVENTQRSDLNPIELAAQVEHLIREHNVDQQTAARMARIDPADLSRLRKVLGLPAGILEAVACGEVNVSRSVLRELAALVDSDERAVLRAVWERIAEDPAEATVKRVQGWIERERGNTDQASGAETERSAQKIRRTINRLGSSLSNLQDADPAVLQQNRSYLETVLERTRALLKRADGAGDPSEEVASDGGAPSPTEARADG